jgi:DNA polymerase type B, organellar and viral
MTQHLTLSSVAKTKFLKYYLKDSKIPLITSSILYNFIYSAYYGGITEVYAPFGLNLTYLDVNSLYPSAILDSMPSNQTYWIESYSEKGLDINSIYGVFFAQVITNNLPIGLLPIKTKEGLIFPNGKFDGTWTSVELQYAASKGYKIKVIKGYQFTKEYNVFDEYVQSLSEQKDKLQGSQRTVVKGLLNSLTGRFALNFVKPKTKIVDSEDLDYILATKKVNTFKEVNENNFIITYLPIVDKTLCEQHNLDYHKVILNESKAKIVDKVDVFKDVSIIISAFATARARIHMHEIKLIIINNGGKLFYSDTDSLVTDLTLTKLIEIMPDKIGDTLGKLNFEYEIDRGYFISNKTYLLKLKSGLCFCFYSCSFAFYFCLLLLPFTFAFYFCL